MKTYNVYPRFDIEIVGGEGCHVLDRNGQRYLDFYGGHAVISIGHAHPHYVKRLEEQLREIAFYSNSVQMPIQEEFASLLGEMSGYPAYHLFLCNSGAEANENALKLASFHTGRRGLVAFEGAFHGRTSLAVGVTDNSKYRAPVNENPAVSFVPRYDLERLAEVLRREESAALIVEGIQGVGGIHTPSVQAWQEIRRLCSQTGTVLIADEIQSGYGRSGRFFAHQQGGIQADLVTVAKGMGNGFPLAGVLIGPHFDAWPGQLGTTFGGNHLACAAGLAVLEVLREEELIDNAALLGEELMAELGEIGGPITEVRGEGLMIGIEMAMPVAELRKKLLYDERVFTGSSSDPRVLRLLPPLSIGALEVEAFVGAMKRTV